MASRSRPESAEQPPEQSVRDVTPQPTEEPETPLYYIATEPLFIGDQFSRAFNVGDRVPAQHVEMYGWADKVRSPLEQPPAAPQTAPETTLGQATTTEKDGA